MIAFSQVNTWFFGASLIQKSLENFFVGLERGWFARIHILFWTFLEDKFFAIYILFDWCFFVLFCFVLFCFVLFCFFFRLVTAHHHLSFQTKRSILYTSEPPLLKHWKTRLESHCLNILSGKESPSLWKTSIFLLQ